MIVTPLVTCLDQRPRSTVSDQRCTQSSSPRVLDLCAQPEYLRTMNENREPVVVAVRTFRANLAEYMDAVRQGATVVITNHGQPVAELRPTNAEVKTIVVHA